MSTEPFQGGMEDTNYFPFGRAQKKWQLKVDKKKMAKIFNKFVKVK